MKDLTIRGTTFSAQAALEMGKTEWLKAHKHLPHATEDVYYKLTGKEKPVKKVDNTTEKV